MKKFFMGKNNLDGSVVSMYADVYGNTYYAFRYRCSKVEGRPFYGRVVFDEDIRQAKKDFDGMLNNAYCANCGKKLDVTTGKYDDKIEDFVCKHCK